MTTEDPSDPQTSDPTDDLVKRIALIAGASVGVLLLCLFTIVICTTIAAKRRKRNRFRRPYRQ